jgi:cell division protein FtsI (penicillin-binding protein 3)
VQRNWRLAVIVGFLLIVFGGIGFRLVQLGITQRHFLQKQGDARIQRNVKIRANRGMIVDRNDHPLAISTPVLSFWFDPRIFKPTTTQIKALAHILSVSPSFIRRRIQKGKGRGFFYLKRRLPPATGPRVKQLHIEGLSSLQEFRRYYPQGAVASHVLGFTNIDDRGQEGLELAYDQWLNGTAGVKAVVRDRLGRVVETVAVKKQPRPGKKLKLSIDERIQYIAYKGLEKAVNKFKARSGSLVVLDAKNGDILAMVNQPSYNPNNRSKVPVGNFRNRAVTDLFEPGSTAKPFTVVQALLSGKYTPGTKINTHPGRMRVGGYTIHDDLDYGIVNLTQLLQKSSNIAAAKIMLSLNPRSYWHLLQAIGLGQRTDSGFPGEADGIVSAHDRWYPSEVATLAYGYGVSVTALQLAHAYSILAAHGLSYPVSFIKRAEPPIPTRVIPEKVSKEVLHMLESVAKKGGSGWRAAIPGYRVAGKTGTAYVASNKGYDKKRYASSFVGIAPASKPRLVIAVVIHEPQNKHFGAIVAAPTFKTVMEQTLHLLNVAPDRLPVRKG